MIGGMNMICRSFHDRTLYDGAGGFVVRINSIIVGVRNNEIDENKSHYQVALEKIKSGIPYLPYDLFENMDSYRANELIKLIA